MPCRNSRRLSETEGASLPMLVMNPTPVMYTFRMFLAQDFSKRRNSQGATEIALCESVNHRQDHNRAACA